MISQKYFEIYLRIKETNVYLGLPVNLLKDRVNIKQTNEIRN